MSFRRPPKPTDRGLRARTACPAGADWTSFAAGGLPDARRAELSRHLLQCSVCRTRQGSSADLLGRLRRFGASPAWEAEVEAASLAHEARVSARRRGALVGVAAAATLAIGMFALPDGSPPTGTPRQPAATASGRTSIERAEQACTGGAVDALLRAQDADGRWRAGSGASGHDEGATGLAVLALVTDRPEALASGPVAQAVGRATRWLTARTADGASTRRGAAGARDQALATAALLEVYAVTRDASLRGPVDRSLRALGRRAAEPDAEAWTSRTLARASALGWHGRTRVVAGTEAVPARVPPWPLAGPATSMCAQALAVLADRPRG